MEVIGIGTGKDLIFKDFINISNITSSRCPIISIYDNPKDYPGHFVARLFDFSEPTKWILVKGSIDEIRAAIPKNMVRFPRCEYDDEKIVESYL